MHGYMYVYLYICLGINFHASVDCPWFLQALRLDAAGCNSTCTLDYCVQYDSKCQLWSFGMYKRFLF